MKHPVPRARRSEGRLGTFKVDLSESSRPLLLKRPHWPTDLDRERAHDDLVVHHGVLAIQLVAAVLRNHVVQVPILQLLGHPLLLVLLGRKRFRIIVAVSMMVLEGPQGVVSVTLTKTTNLPEHPL